MDNVPEPIRLLVLDAGDIRAISQLVILENFLGLVAWNKGLETLHPCDYFHLMAGVGSSGIIITLLSRLRLSIEDTIEEFITIWAAVFANSTMTPVERSQKLRSMLKDLLRRKGFDEDLKFFAGDATPSRSSALICASPAANLTSCQKLRTYHSPEKPIDITVVDAILATCSLPQILLPVRIGHKPLDLEVVSGQLKFSNPTREAIQEARSTCDTKRRISCILSLGCGRPDSSFSEQLRSRNTQQQHSWNASLDSDRVATELEAQIGTSHIYHRFSVEQGLHSYDDAHLHNLGVIKAITNAYLDQPKVHRALETCASISQGAGECTLDDIYRSPSQLFTATQGVPLLSASFVPRRRLMDTIRARIAALDHHSQRCLILSGLSGIGKTQIVLSFLRTPGHGYGPIFFIEASSKESIERGLITRVNSLGVEYQCTQVSEALNRLARPDQNIKSWVIVFDDVGSNIELSRYFPLCEFGMIIVTTQNPDYGSLSPQSHIRVDLMSEDEAVAALLKSVFPSNVKPTNEDRTHARRIVSEVGFLPVAVVQAGHFIKKHRCMSTYVDRLRANRPDILSRPATAQLDNHYHGIYTALNVTWGKLSPSAQQLLNILTFLKYTGFPLELIYRAGPSGFQYEPFQLFDRSQEFHKVTGLLCQTFHYQGGETSAWNRQRIDDLIEELEQYSLVTPVINFSSMTLHLHPLVHAFAYDRLEPQARPFYREAAIRLLICGSGEENRDLYESISPHMRVILSHKGPIHANDLGGIANVFYYEGKVKDATKIWEEIRESTISAYGEDDLRSSEATLQLAKMCWEFVDRRIEARIWEDRVLELRSKILPRDHPLIARAMSQRARGLEYRNQLSEAEALRLEVLKVWKTSPDGNAEEILQEKDNLALTYRYQRKWSKAQNLWTEIWQARIISHGEQHWKTLKAMESLANLYDAIGGESTSLSQVEVDDGEHGKVAEKLWQDLIDARTKMKGPLHPDTLYALQSLAWCYEIQQRDAEAEAQWEKVLRLRERVQGSGHEATWQAMNALAFFDRKNGRDKQAEIRWKMTIDASKAQGIVTRQSSKAIESLAKLYRKQGYEKEANCLHEQISNMTLSQDREIRTRYQKALMLLNINHQAIGPQPPQKVLAKQATGVGVSQRQSSRSDSSPYSPRHISQPDTLTVSSRGESHLLPNVSELIAGQHSVGVTTDSPNYIRRIRDDYRSPDIPGNHLVYKSPEHSVLLSSSEILNQTQAPHIVITEVVSDPYYDALEDQIEETEQWGFAKASISERLLPHAHRNEQDTEGLRAPQATPAIQDDEPLPQVTDVVLLPQNLHVVERETPVVNVQASCLQLLFASMRGLVGRMKSHFFETIRHGSYKKRNPTDAYVGQGSDPIDNHT